MDSAVSGPHGEFLFERSSITRRATSYTVPEANAITGWGSGRPIRAGLDFREAEIKVHRKSHQLKASTVGALPAECYALEPPVDATGDLPSYVYRHSALFRASSRHSDGRRHGEKVDGHGLGQMIGQEGSPVLGWRLVQDQAKALRCYHDGVALLVGFGAPACRSCSPTPSSAATSGPRSDSVRDVRRS